MYGLSRVILSPLVPVPGVMPIDPFPVFWVLGHSRCGKRLLPVLLLTMALMDTWIPMAGAVRAMRLAGALALCRTSVTSGTSFRQLMLLAVTLPLWTAVPSEYSRLYPYTYVYAAGLIQGLCWCGICAGLASSSLRPLNILLGIPVAVLGLHVAGQAPALFPVPLLGETSGILIRILGPMLLILPHVPELMSGIRRKKNGGKRTGLSTSPVWRDFLHR